MKKTTSLLTFSLLAILVWDTSFAQQDPQYTQYMYNMNVINPAYAGSREGLAGTILYRDQWSGFTDNYRDISGNIVTYTLSLHAPVADKMGLGFSAVRDEIGPIVTETNAYVDYSYTLDLGTSIKLALGIKAGATFHEVGLSNLQVIDPNDPLFAEDLSGVYPNVGAGAFLYDENWYVGLSMPNFISSTHLDEDRNGEQIVFGNETQHYFGTAGYVFDVSDNLKLKPHVMVKSSFDAPLSFDANLNALIIDRVEVGGSYRLDDSWSGLIGVFVTDNLRIGYAYDRIMSDLNYTTDASHEIILTFDLQFGRKAMVSPRFF